nr:hypothetical protein BaRGS_026868 [Batillaria attramentaria]
MDARAPGKIRFLHMDIKGLSYPCKTDHVTLHIASALNVSNTDNKLTFCKNVLPEPILEWTGKVTVRFVSGYKGRNTGFKLLFSFHEYFKAPEKLPGDHPDFEWFTFDRGVKTQAILFGTCDTLRKISALCELPENDTPSVSVPRLPRVSLVIVVQ